MAYYHLCDIVSDDSNDFWLHYSEGSADFSSYTCTQVTDSVQNLDCGAGLILYYLVPITGAYRTRHSSCSASSCGFKAPCNSSDGSCMCTCDNGIQTTDIYSTCRDYCGITAIVYDMLDMDTNRLHGKMKKKDEAKTNNDINNTLNNPVLAQAMVVGVNGSKLCLTWENWVNDSCRIIPIDSNRTMCSCDDPENTDDINQGFTGEHLDMLIVVVMPVGLLFLSLTLLTFVLCGRQLNVTNTAQVNLCISLLLAHLLFLFKGGFLKYIRANQLACAVLAALLHFLFLSSFVWMFIDAVLLFISAKNLTKIRSKQKKMLGWKYLTVIGYVIPLIVVGVSVAAVPNGYGSETCWLKSDRGLLLEFVGPCVFHSCSKCDSLHHHLHHCHFQPEKPEQ
ncbi:putative adhesion G protein-coupled receptor E4P [Colossoma macropomum]|uniref:putative adhesion G protein-coupled receptor E4P n=1 Tax=Colossoma macropomum TaxID=42526 RepID=UPI001863DB63|nr:putative adhesion G protein-coupled receptor E4P [Colossoma macropomum]